MPHRRLFFVALLLAFWLAGSTQAPHAQALPAQDGDAIPGDPQNNSTKWIVLGVGGTAMIALGIGALSWKSRLDKKMNTQPAPEPDPFAAPTGPPSAERTPLPNSGVIQPTAGAPPTTDGPVLPPSLLSPSTQPTAGPNTPPLAPDPRTEASPTPTEATDQPVFDRARGTYVQWDPESELWMVYNQATKAWAVES